MPKEIPLTQGKVAIVDDEDYERLSQFKWHVKHDKIWNQWIARRWERTTNRCVYLSAEVFGDVPSGFIIDHRSRNTLDNRRDNLRLARYWQSSANRSFYNPSGAKGVSKHHTKFRAKISVRGKVRYLGRFETAEEAGAAYVRAAKELHGEFACLEVKKN